MWPKKMPNVLQTKHNPDFYLLCQWRTNIMMQATGVGPCCFEGKGDISL